MINQPISEGINPENKKLVKCHQKLSALTRAIAAKQPPAEVEEKINKHISSLAQAKSDETELLKATRKVHKAISQLVQKDMGLVVKGYYMALWMSLGLTLFGMPLGVAFSASMDNYGLIGTMMPVGMAIGLAIGIGLDKKAAKEGRQLVLD